MINGIKKLKIKWSKRENDFMIYYPRSCDGSLISELLKPWKFLVMRAIKHNWSEPSYKENTAYNGVTGMYTLMEMDWLKELDRRGYDLKTLKFEISMKEEKKKDLQGPSLDTNADK